MKHPYVHFQGQYTNERLVKKLVKFLASYHLGRDAKVTYVEAEEALVMFKLGKLPNSYYVGLGKDGRKYKFKPKPSRGGLKRRYYKTYYIIMESWISQYSTTVAKMSTEASVFVEGYRAAR